MINNGDTPPTWSATSTHGTSLRIGLVQMRCEKGEIATNLTRIHAYLREAHARQVDILCFPEMSITGYINPVHQPAAVLRLDSPEVAQFVAMTAEFPLTAIAGIVEANGQEKPFITQIVASAGKFLGYYRKKTIPDDEAGWFSAGETITIFTHPAITFGVAVCADIGSPEIFAESAKRGARLVFAAAAPGLYGPQSRRDWGAGFAWWRNECMTKLHQYARANRITIAVATQAGRTVDEDFPGGGYVFAPDGTCVAATPDWSEGVLYVTIPQGDWDGTDHEFSSRE